MQISKTNTKLIKFQGNHKELKLTKQRFTDRKA